MTPEEFMVLMLANQDQFRSIMQEIQGDNPAAAQLNAANVPEIASTQGGFRCSGSPSLRSGSCRWKLILRMGIPKIIADDTKFTHVLQALPKRSSQTATTLCLKPGRISMKSLRQP